MLNHYTYSLPLLLQSLFLCTFLVHRNAVGPWPEARTLPSWPLVTLPAFGRSTQTRRRRRRPGDEAGSQSYLTNGKFHADTNDSMCVCICSACMYIPSSSLVGGMLHVLHAPSRTRVRISSGLTALRILLCFCFCFLSVFLCHAFPPVWGRQHFTPTNCDDIGLSASASDLRSLLGYSSLSNRPRPPVLVLLSLSLCLPIFPSETLAPYKRKRQT